MFTKAILTAVSFVALLPLAPVAPVQAQASQKAAVSMPPSADALITAAKKQARDSRKAVLVVFHASWCGWCKQLDTKLLNDPAMGKLLSVHYVIVHLDVLENPEKKRLENPGADTWLTTLGGAQAGLPFYAVLDQNGAKVSDSLRMEKKANIGYPASPAEISAFIGLLKTTAPRMTEADRSRIASHLTKNAP